MRLPSLLLQPECGMRATQGECTSAVARGIRSVGSSNMLTFEAMGFERWQECAC